MQLRPFSLVSVFIWKLSSGHFQMLFHGQPNSECLKPKAVTFFTKHSSECLSQWHPCISLLKYFLNLSSHCCGDYQYPIQILILLYHSKYWNSLLNNFSTACSLQIHPHSWLPFSFLKPFNNSPLFPQDNVMVFKTQRSTPRLPLQLHLCPFLPVSWGSIQTRLLIVAHMLFFSCHYALILCGPMLFFRNYSLLNNILPPSLPIHQPN